MTLTNEKKILRVFTVAALTLALPLIVMRTVALFKYYDLSVCLFDRDAVLPEIYSLLLVVFSLLIGVLLAAYLLLYGKGINDGITINDRASTVLFGAALCGFMAAAVAIREVIILSRGGLNTRDRVIAILIALLALPAVASFFITVFSPVDGRNDLRGFLSMAPALVSVLLTFVLYFDRTTLINDPNKILMSTGLVFASLFYLYECRFRLGAPKKRLYIFFAAAAGFLCTVSALPQIIYYFATSVPLQISTIFDFFTLVSGIYALSRLSTMRAVIKK